MKANNILELIGETPHLKLERLFADSDVWIKLERQNPGGSIKDRIALAMIRAAEADGSLQPGGTIIEPTSGNTGIGLALAGKQLGYRVILVMPESASIERGRLMRALGAETVLTPRSEGMKGSIERAMQMQEEIPGSFLPMQFENGANADAHYQTTAEEIVRDFPDGIGCLVSGVGSGGHITGVGRKLRELFPEVKIFAVEPSESAVLSGEEANPHGIQGIGAGFIPKVLDRSLLTGVIPVSVEEATRALRELILQEGVLGGISTGASIAAIQKIFAERKDCGRVLTFNYDTVERYYSVGGLMP